MNFLQPALLAALPIMALPIIIHLINQRRYQTVNWGAMMFLLAANRMSRGYARLRQWLIMAFRMLAIAALIFAVSRPLVGGWLGTTAGGRADTTLILLDCSPSMQQDRRGAGASKLETGRRQLAEALQTVGSGRYVLIDGSPAGPRELETAQDLLSAAVTPTSGAADLPGLLQTAFEYIRDNQTGRTEVWICSDLRENDWQAASGRWPSLRAAFTGFAQEVRFHLLAFPQPAPGNLAIRVSNVQRVQSGDQAELLLTLHITREGAEDVRASVPVQIEIAGARSELTVEMAGPQFELKGHRLALDKSVTRGWGKVSLPADANAADNDFYFVFAPSPPRQTLIVAEPAAAVDPLQLAASIPPDPAVRCTVETVLPDQLSSVDWENVGLLLWQAPLPEGDAARDVQAFVERGGQVIVFPPQAPTDVELFGLHWGEWIETPGELTVDTWRSDEDLLAHTQSGSNLPVGRIEVRRRCECLGKFTPLAALRDGLPLFVRADQQSGVYFCATTPAPADSSLAMNGVVLYVFVQRALATGAAALGTVRQLIAGDPGVEQPANWQPVTMALGSSTDYALQRGVYAAGERLLAVNRPAAEDQAPVLSDERVPDLFRGLDFSRVDEQEGSLASLVQEIWRLFLVTMMVSLLVEALLCLPRSAHAETAARQPVRQPARREFTLRAAR